MQCSSEEFPLGGTEDCWVPLPLLQSFVACKWQSHSFLPDTSSFPYCKVKLLHLWPTRRVSVVFVTMQGGNSCCHWKSRVLVLSWSHLFYVICIQQFKFIFLHEYIIQKKTIDTQITNNYFGHSHLLPTLQMDANQCRLMCDLQRLSRTTFLHLSVPLSSERWLNCWATLFVLKIGCCIGRALKCEFHTEQWGEPCSVPVGCLPHAFLQSIVCKSAVNCLKSWRVALLSQVWWQEGAFACTHTSFFACTSQIWWLYWLGTCVNFIPNSEWSLALFLLVVCPMLFCNQQSAGVQLIVWRAEAWHCFCRIGSGKVPSHAPYFLLTLLLFFVPYSTTWPWRITFLCWRVQ
jgi:hypothetical protein